MKMTPTNEAKKLKNDATLAAEDLIEWCGAEPLSKCLEINEERYDELMEHWAKTLFDGYPKARDVAHVFHISIETADQALRKSKERHAANFCTT